MKHDIHVDCLCAVIGCQNYRDKVNGFDGKLTCDKHTCKHTTCYLPAEYESSSYCKYHKPKTSATTESKLAYKPNKIPMIIQLMETGHVNILPATPIPSAPPKYTI